MDCEYCMCSTLQAGFFLFESLDGVKSFAALFPLQPCVHEEHSCLITDGKKSAGM